MKNYKITIKNILDSNQETFKTFDFFSEDIKKALSKAFKNNKLELKKKSLKFNCILITEFIEVINNNNTNNNTNNNQTAINNQSTNITNNKHNYKYKVTFTNGLFKLYNKHGFIVGYATTLSTLESQLNYNLKEFMGRKIIYY